MIYLGLNESSSGSLEPESIEFFLGGELLASSNISVPSGISSWIACIPDLDTEETHLQDKKLFFSKALLYIHPKQFF